MLKRAQEKDIYSITDLCSDSIIGTKILCQIMAYGFQRSFLEIWLEEVDGEITGILTKFFDDATLMLSEKSDIEQLDSFLMMLNYNSLMCTEESCKMLGIKDYTVKTAFLYDGDEPDFNADLLKEDDYRKAYQLISQLIPGSFSDNEEAYLSFLSDFTFRHRRNLARGLCTHKDNCLSSVALTSSETESAAIISGVACNSQLQKKGLGKQTVLSLVGLLAKEKKNVYVIALNENAEGFYRHIGFKETGKIAFIERKYDV